MRKVIADEWLSLDGVIQAPGQPDEDPSGGFQHGGWHVGYFDDIAQRQVVDSVVKAGGFLLGRRTYEIFAAHWPNASEEEQVLAEPLAFGFDRSEKRHLEALAMLRLDVQRSQSTG